MATTDYSLAHTLPANVEAERSILGAILLDNLAYNEAAEHLKPEDFSLDSHRRIFTPDRHDYAGRGVGPAQGTGGDWRRRLHLWIGGRGPRSAEHRALHQNRPRQGAAAGTDSRRQRRHCASLRPKRSRRRNLERRRSRYLPA